MPRARTACSLATVAKCLRGMTLLYSNQKSNRSPISTRWSPGSGISSRNAWNAVPTAGGPLPRGASATMITPVVSLWRDTAQPYEAGTTPANALPVCGEGFSSGCRHGVIQAYFEARDKVTQPEVEALCQPFKGATASRWVLFQCVHGMGHGLTMLYSHDLPRALTDCDLLGDGWDRESCYGGAFMESVINATAPQHPATMLSAHSHHHMRPTTIKALDPADPLYPCSTMYERYLAACYLMQTSGMI